MPETGSYLETVPAVLEQSDLGVTSVAVGSSLDGLGRFVSLHVRLDRDHVTSAEIVETLELVADKLDQPGASELRLVFWDDANTATIDSEAECEAIGSSIVGCDYNTISIDLDDLRAEFGE